MAYNKPNELKILKLENDFLSEENFSVLLPQNKLSDWRVGQTLIIVFGKFFVVTQRISSQVHPQGSRSDPWRTSHKSTTCHSRKMPNPLDVCVQGFGRSTSITNHPHNTSTLFPPPLLSVLLDLHGSLLSLYPPLMNVRVRAPQHKPRGNTIYLGPG